MVEPIYRIPAEMLVDFGYLPVMPAVNSPHYTYGKGTDCAHTIEVPIRETHIACVLCATEHEHSLLRRIYTAPAMQQVWWEHWNPATGHVESDRKRMQHRLDAQADQVSESTGIGHTFTRGDFSEYGKDRAAKGADKYGKEFGEGLVATHNKAVASRKRDSKGKFVHTIK